MGGAAGFGLKWALGEDAPDSLGRAASTASASSGNAGGEGGGTPRPKLPRNLVSELCFDADPLAYVDVDECRELIFQVTGRRVAVTDEEVDEQCSDWAEAGRLKKAQEIAEGIIEKFCITEEEDVAAIYAATGEGYIVLDDILSSGEKLWLSKNVKNGESKIIELKTPVLCGTVKMKSLLEDKDLSGALEAMEMDTIEETLQKAGAQDMLSGWLNEIKDTRQALLDESDPNERSRIACDYLLQKNWDMALVDSFKRSIQQGEPKEEVLARAAAMYSQLEGTSVFEYDGFVYLFKEAIANFVTTPADRRRCSIKTAEEIQNEMNELKRREVREFDQQNQ